MPLVMEAGSRPLAAGAAGSAAGSTAAGALAASDRLVVPVFPGRYALDGLRRTLQVVEHIQNGLNPNLTLAGILMLSLIDAARARGMRRMEAFILASNDKMIKFARQLGFDVRRDADDPGMMHAQRSL